MRHKSQLFPLSSACETSLRRRIGRLWGWSSTDFQNADLEGVKFLRSWLVYDSEIQIAPSQGEINWIAGLTLAIVVSAGFWAGLGMVVAYIWK